MAGTTAWILGDQLSLANPALEGADRVLLVQSTASLRARRYHRQKLQLVLVAMRHFADDLRERGVAVDLVHADSLVAGLQRHRERRRPERVRLLRPSSADGARRLARLPGVEIAPGSLFLSDLEDFGRWADGRRRLVMEHFYRRQRRRLHLLMDGNEPVGGRWNFDAENRRPPPAEVAPPPPYRPRESDHDRAVRGELDRLGVQTWGQDGPRLWPADRAQARRALRRFVDDALPTFGPYQDALVSGQRTLWHSLLSSSLNLGLVSPLECAQAAEAAYREGRAPLASAEGFIRQVIGWREYVWCLYWYRESEWGDANALGAHGPLPGVLEHGETEMRCLRDAVGGLRATAYAHHIERLMLFGNLLLLCGTEPGAALDWFQRAFIDGYPWVMAPNVLGMATWADGGRMMTKPYAASGRYIERMSDHCDGCRYDPGERSGETACPFTTLYWDFLSRNRTTLAANRRMAPVLGNLDRIDETERRRIREQARDLRERFDA
ncbi:MAG: cryptochrome/photolyase family protein [Solirubrobacterales bacterium]|nr:cryptochrome/photolyase family protein [Solirubrobacterales bacterium]